MKGITSAEVDGMGVRPKPLNGRRAQKLKDQARWTLWKVPTRGKPGEPELTADGKRIVTEGAEKQQNNHRILKAFGPFRGQFQVLRAHPFARFNEPKRSIVKRNLRKLRQAIRKLDATPHTKAFAELRGIRAVAVRRHAASVRRPVAPQPTAPKPSEGATS